MRGRKQSDRGKYRQEGVYRHLGHRDIGNPGDKVFMQIGIVKLKILIRGEVLLWEPAVSILKKWEVSFKGPAVSIAENRGSKDRES
jgi:hypothetical protein